MRAISVLLLLVCILAAVCGFQVAAPSSCTISRNVAPTHSNRLVSLKLANDPDEEQKVRVDLVEDVDPFSLTAIGFTLIAFNFLVLANLGDGGIGGLTARIINFINS